ncbi:MAG: transaldolase [Candidatus Omnitrophica bacterium]|nr:transaldolase [Candidatus Omnitrophota bacterium]
MPTKLHDIARLGQSLWIDNINRSMITGGKLKSLIEKGLRGQTSNPTIFKQAISQSSDYDAAIEQLARAGRSTFEIYDELTIQDVQEAAHLFSGVYEQTKGLDGYVSLEINPKLGNELDAQLKEGQRLWKKLNRPNVMIKVPATKNGLGVVEGLIAQGINVNVTLIFSAEQYQQVAWAYLKGLQRLAMAGGDVGRVRSVASVFVSRVDTSIDKKLDAQNEIGLRGKAAVANAAIIYHKFQKNFNSDEFKALKAQGAHLQRVLWASTGTKDPQYSDLKYVTELIASDTVNTVPDKTLEAVLDHGVSKPALPGDPAAAQQIFEGLRLKGIDVGMVCNQLLDEGLAAFERSFEELTACLEEKQAKLSAQAKN